MKRILYIVLLLLLAGLLVASNSWWFYQTLDRASIEKYHGQMLYERLHALTALQKVVPGLASSLPREEVVRRVEAALEADPQDTFEKDGWVVIDWVHLRFNQSDQLVELGPDYSPE